MITGLLLLPVLCILVWLYWYLLPERRWRFRDASCRTRTGFGCLGRAPPGW